MCNTPQVRNLKLIDFFKNGEQIKNVEKIRTLIGQPDTHVFTLKKLIYHIECLFTAQKDGKFVDKPKMKPKTPYTLLWDSQ